MTYPLCEDVRDRLPDFEARRLDDIAAAHSQAHLDACRACRDELELVRLLREAAPAPAPATLEARVLQTLGRPRRRFWNAPVMAAAASIMVALVGGSLLIRAGAGPLRIDVEAMVAAEALGGFNWAQPGDPLLLMSPGLHALSDDELEALLKEMES
jgi:hypothetical protein